MKQENFNIEEIIVKYLQGNSKSSENEILLEWLRENPVNKKIFGDLTVIWFSSYKKEAVFDPEKAFEKFKTSISSPQKEKKSNKKGLIVKLISSIAALFILAAGTYFYFNNIEKSTIITAKSTKIADLTLPDGTKIFMKGNSCVRYPDKFSNKSRLVSMNGDVYFEVEKNPELPFIIKTGFASIEVVGTSFNVVNDSIAKFVRVIVSSGKVKLFDHSGKNFIILEEGFAGTYDRKSNKLVKYLNNDINYLSWKTNKLVFKNTELSEIFRDIARHYNVSINTVNPEILDCRMTATFEKQPMDSVISIIKLTFGLKATEESGVIIFDGKGCR